MRRDRNNSKGDSMKLIHEGKRYDTAKCTVLAGVDHYSHSNNYSGTTYLLRASDGQLLLHTESNGQNCYLSNDVNAIDPDQAQDWLSQTNADIQDDVDMTGLIVDVP